MAKYVFVTGGVTSSLGKGITAASIGRLLKSRGLSVSILKLDPGEGWHECALREVMEETGLRCELGEELSPTFYEDRKGRPKAVRYWLMTPEEEPGEFEPNDEVDELRWLPAGEATELLTYEHDIDLAQEVSDL